MFALLIFKRQFLLVDPTEDCIVIKSYRKSQNSFYEVMGDNESFAPIFPIYVDTLIKKFGLELDGETGTNAVQIYENQILPVAKEYIQSLCNSQFEPEDIIQKQWLLNQINELDDMIGRCCYTKDDFIGNQYIQLRQRFLDEYDGIGQPSKHKEFLDFAVHLQSYFLDFPIEYQESENSVHDVTQSIYMDMQKLDLNQIVKEYLDNK